MADDWTEMGGPNRRFAPTEQDVLRKAAEAGSEEGAAARSTIFGQYWKPVYAYLRRRGHDSERAKDLTQGFFAAVLARADFLQRYDPLRGKFRTYLLQALNQYLQQVHRFETAQKRLPPGGIISLEDLDVSHPPGFDDEATAEDNYLRTWAWQLVLGALERAREDLPEKAWRAFEMRIALPWTQGAPPVPVARAARQLGLANPGSVSALVGRAKEAFRESLLTLIGQYVRCDQEAEGELEELFHLLTPPGATS